MGDNGTKMTYYDTLGLKEGCTHEEIRESFVKMSKLYHPDKDATDPLLHNKFIKINEAYSVLGKPLLRKSYDFQLQNSRSFKYSSDYRSEPSSYVWRDDSIWPRKGGAQETNYYGIKGVKRKPNSWIATGCFIFVGLGLIFHYYAFKHSRTFRIAQLDIKDRRLSSELDVARNKAVKNGNEIQLDLLSQKLRSPPTTTKDEED